MAVWRMRIACWIPKAADTHSECYTNCFSLVTMIARTRLHGTLHVLACLAINVFHRLNGFGPVVELHCAGNTNVFISMGSGW